MGVALGKTLCICPNCGKVVLLKSPSLAAKFNNYDGSFTYKNKIIRIQDGTIVHKCQGIPQTASYLLGGLSVCVL